jgi:two-component system, NtrC family, sensor kinase
MWKVRMEMDESQRILIVDDDRAIRESYREILASRERSALTMGDSLFGTGETPVYTVPVAFDIEDAAGGEQAVSMVLRNKEQGNRYRVAFVDMKMPGINGAETVREIWTVDPDIKVVIVTAFSDTPPDEIVQTVGREDIFYLRKPFNPEEIRQFARALCSQWAFDRNRERQLQLKEVRKTESLACMAGAIAHHLNNLLQVVTGNLELLREELPPEGMAIQRVERADKGVQRGISLGERLLAYVGQRVRNETDCDLAVEVARLIPEIQTILSPEIRLKTRLGSLLPLIRLDPGLLDEALSGLVRNAGEAIGSGEGTVHLETGEEIFDPNMWQKIVPAEMNGRCVYLEVSDNGCGMDTNTLDLMFDPFFSTRFTGRGLGLAVIQGIVQSHGGWIAVSSRPGERTTVRMCFPHGIRRETCAKNDLPGQEADTSRRVTDAKGNDI